MRRVAIVLAALITLSAPGAAGQILSDADVAHFAGCFSLQPGEWDLGAWDLAAEELPPLPTQLRLRMSPAGPYAGASWSSLHVISHTPVERIADAYDAAGSRLASFQSWRAPNPRSFSVGRIAQAPAVQLAGLTTDSSVFRLRMVFIPPGMNVVAGFGGRIPNVVFAVRRVECG